MSIDELIHRTLSSLHTRLCAQISDASSDVISYLTDVIYFNNLENLGQNSSKGKALEFEQDALNVFNNECQRTYQYLVDIQLYQSGEKSENHRLSIKTRDSKELKTVKTQKITKSTALL